VTLNKEGDEEMNKEEIAKLDYSLFITLDAIIMALRLIGEDESTFSPECAEVVARWRKLLTSAEYLSLADE
jgi:hypothetical protein